MKHDNNFDLLRLIAAAQVAMEHAARLHVSLPAALQTFMEMFSFVPIMEMFPGVPIFFVMSGFLVAKSLMENQGHLGRYFTNRALRIYPGLWVNLTAILILLMVAGVLGGTAQPPAAWMERYLPILYITGSNELAGASTPIELFFWNGFIRGWPGGALWTIPVEIGFYILLPVLLAPLLIGFRKVGIAVLALTAVASATYASHYFQEGLLNQTPVFYLWIFLIGSGAYVVWPRIKGFFENRFMLWLAAYGALCLGPLWLQGVPAYCFYATPTVIGVLKVALLSGCVLSFAFSFAGASRWLRGVDLSYGIYLHHFPIICVFAGLGWTGIAWLPALGAFVLMAAAASWFLVERPALGLKKYSARRLEPVLRS